MQVETASGVYDFPDDPAGFTSAVIDNLTADGAQDAAADVGQYVISADGSPVYISAGMPSWVVDAQLAAHGGLPPDAPVIRVPPLPAVVATTPPSGPQPTNRAVPVALPPAGASPPSVQPRTPTIIEAVTGGAAALVNGVTDVADSVRRGVGGALSAAGDVIGGALNRVLDTTRGVINLLVPTVSELAFGLVNKFHDLAGFMVDKAATITDFTGALAGGMHAALSDIFGAPFVWLLRGLTWFVRLFTAPLASLAASLPPVVRVLPL